MTRPTTMDRTRLAAFADGELDPDKAAEVVLHLADHPQDQAYVDDLMAANEALARAFAAPARAPVPDRFTRLILPEEAGPGSAPQGAAVLPFRPRPAARGALWAALGAGLGVAATLAALVVLPGGDGGPAGALAVGPVAPGSALETALATARSGAAVAAGQGVEVTLLATLPAGDGLCREFEARDPARAVLRLGLACQEASGWVVDVLIAETLAAPDVADDGFRPAAAGQVGALDPWLDRRGAGMALTPAEEAARLRP